MSLRTTQRSIEFELLHIQPPHTHISKRIRAVWLACARFARSLVSHASMCVCVCLLLIRGWTKLAWLCTQRNTALIQLYAPFLGFFFLHFVVYCIVWHAIYEPLKANVNIAGRLYCTHLVWCDTHTHTHEYDIAAGIRSERWSERDFGLSWIFCFVLFCFFVRKCACQKGNQNLYHRNNRKRFISEQPFCPSTTIASIQMHHYQ